MILIEFDKAPLKTQWGSCMRHAIVAIDKDNCLDLYCTDDQIHNVMKTLKELAKKGKVIDKVQNNIR